MIGAGLRRLLGGLALILMLGGLFWGVIAVVVGMGADRAAAAAFTAAPASVALVVLLSVVGGAILRVLLSIDARLETRS